MVNRSVLLRATVAGVLVCLGLAGCGALRTSQNTDVYQAVLSGAQEVPPVATSGSGQAEVQFNRNTSVLYWKVTHAGLSGPVTGAHIHGPAGPGQNAGVVIPFAGNLNAATLSGEARITPEQGNQLESGQWYVNLHTVRHPGGEIRGQLRQRR